MAHVHNTVFISHRSTNKSHALLLYKSLEERGYDCFLDINSMESGEFPDQLEGNIKARAHFVVILTPSALGYAYKPNSWIRREVEVAVASGRNIIPLIFDGFSFDTAREEEWLEGKALPKLPNYRAIEIQWDLIGRAVELLCSENYLDKPVNVIIHALNTEIRTMTEQQKQECAEKPAPTQSELSAEEYFERGLEANLDSNYDKAIEYYDRAIELNPRNAAAYNFRGVILGQKGEHDTALTDYATAIELKADEAQFYYNRGLSLHRKGELDIAIANYNTAIDLDPIYVAAYNNRGLAYAAKNELNAAIADYKRAIKINPDTLYAVYAYTNQGNAYQQKGKFNAAIANYDIAIALKPDHMPAYYNRGIAHGKKGKLDAAIADCTRAIELEPDESIAYNNRGIAYQRKGELDAAIADYNKAIELDPNSDCAHHNRGEVYFQLHMFQEARNDLEKAVILDGNYQPHKAGLAITQHALGEIEEAKSLWRELLAIDERYSNADWVGKEFNWHKSLVEEVRKVIGRFTDDDYSKIIPRSQESPQSNQTSGFASGLRVTLRRLLTRFRR